MLFLFLEDLIGNMRREEQSETNLSQSVEDHKPICDRPQRQKPI
jgi:hypothetical protein